MDPSQMDPARLMLTDNQLYQKAIDDGWQKKAHLAYQSLIDLADSFREGHDWGGLKDLSNIMEQFYEHFSVNRHEETMKVIIENRREKCEHRLQCITGESK